MKKIILLFLAGAAVLPSLFAGPARDSDGAAREGVSSVIEIGGSTSVAPLMERLAEGYRAVRPQVRININGTGSGDGIKNAGSLYQIGMTSRDLTPMEQGQGLVERVIAIDGIAVIVNGENPVSGLSIAQIRNIYTGAITDWSQVSGGTKRGRIAVTSREAGSGTRTAFEELAGFPGGLLAGANESTSTGAIKAGISRNPDSIGYISLGSLDGSVKSLEVDGTAPTTANVKNGSYRLARPFIVLYRQDIDPEARAFLEWVSGPEGQAIVGTGWIQVTE